MKKIITFIITLSIILSSLSTTFAEEWYIERLLDLNYQVEEYSLDLTEINYIHFNDDKYNKMYNELKTVNSLLKKWFITNYKNWEFDYYQISWIVKNYNDFIYHTNQFFFFIKLKEQRPYYKELDSAILNSSRNMRSSYSKVKNITRGY